ncbi:MAG TPA: hypothetical protein VI756_18900 [Blastocatellia bacterium]
MKLVALCPRLAVLTVIAIGLSVSLVFPHSPGHYTQNPDLATGTIIQKVLCQADTQFSYALYLPSTYRKDKKWPIVYCFDPSARGAAPLERFRVGAEQYGFILAGSNDSKNGPGPIGTIIRALLQDTQARFSIDPRQVYLTGLSGGARVASAVALAMPSAIAGVIACSAGFLPSAEPPRPLPFPFFATAGTEDFNYPEMYNLAETLTASGSANHLAVFDGPHSWPPPEVCTEALEWMQLQAMRSGRREKDPALIHSIERKWVERANALDAGARKYEAFRAYTELATALAGLDDVTAFKSEAAELGPSKEVKQALKEQKEMIEKQRARTRELINFSIALVGRPDIKGQDAQGDQTPASSSGQMGGGQMASPATRMGSTGMSTDTQSSSQSDKSMALADLKRAVESLKKAEDGPAGSPSRLVARRVLSGFMVGLYETAQGLTYNRSYARAVQVLSVGTAVRPESQGLFLELAKAYAGLNQKDKALDALKKAVSNGLSNASAIEDDPDFGSLKNDPEYQRIIDGMKKGGDRG